MSLPDLQPPLRAPILVAAFEGWNDAGDAATDAVEHLADVWDATEAWALDPDEYYDFQVNRPTVALEDGTTRRISWPTTRFLAARIPEAERDLVLVRGVEPNMRGRGFCEELLRAAEALGVVEVVTLGALLADTPHTRPVPVSGTSSHPGLAAQLGLEHSRYEGPTGIVLEHPDDTGGAHVAAGARAPALRGASSPSRGPRSARE